MINKRNISGLILIFLTIVSGQNLAAEIDNSNLKLEPGTYIPSLIDKRYTQPFVVQRLTDNSYIAIVSAFNATFYVGKEGIMLIETMPAGMTPGLIAAIRSVTSLPITTLIYSHYHMDHSGGSEVIANDTRKMGKEINIVATRAVATQIERYGNKIPMPTQIIENDKGEFEFEGQKIQIQRPALGGGHTPDNSIIYLPGERIIHYVDLVHPEIFFPYFDLDAYDILAVRDSLHEILGMEWDYLNGGHGNIGSKKDVNATLTYLDDLENALVAAIKAEPFGPHVDFPNTGEFSWIKSYHDALVDRAVPTLRKKYRHITDFDVVIGGHLVAMYHYLSLY